MQRVYVCLEEERRKREEENLGWEWEGLRDKGREGKSLKNSIKDKYSVFKSLQVFDLLPL